MNKKWMPITAGVLDIISGACATFLGLVLVTIRYEVRTYGSYPIYYDIVAPLLVVIGVLAIVGGIYTIKGNIWPLALTGAIAGLLASTPWVYIYWSGFNISDFFDILILFNLTAVPGIVAIVLTVLSRKQFDRR
jgi:hypothetical protein